MKGQKEEETILESLRRFLNLVSKPPDYIIDQRHRLRYQFILGFTLVSCPILVFAQVVSSEGIFGVPIFWIPALLIFTGFILSRYGYLDLAITIDILSFSFYPYVSLLFKGFWDSDYSFLILIWIPITMLIGGYLLDQNHAGLFILIHDIVFLTTVLAHPGAHILMSSFLETVLPLFSISLLIYVGSWTRQRHVNQLDQLNHELDAKNQELNIYTSLLVHDIGNDVQLSLVNSELASQLLVSDPSSAREHILAAFAVEQRMSALLKVFSEPQVIIQTDIVNLIESIAEQAQITHGNLEIIVTSDEQCRTYGVASRLLPMVFSNLFRNSATHAGKTPNVKVSITMSENDIAVIVTDDGPGVDSSIRDNLFEKGVTGANSESTGMGLYLIKQIVEIHNGTISLLDEDKCEGCGFRITLPSTSFSKIT